MKRLFLLSLTSLSLVLTGCDDVLKVTNKTYGAFHEWSKHHVTDPAEIEITRILTEQGQKVTERMETSVKVYREKKDEKEIQNIQMLARTLQQHMDMYLSDSVVKESPNLYMYEKFTAALNSDAHDLNALIPRAQSQMPVTTLLPKVRGLKKVFESRLKELPK
jgi:ATP/maltotriose-dependent transcriptional regulator MalT